MFALGKLSVRMVAPFANTALARPLFDTVSVQVQLLPSVVALETLLALVACRSGRLTARVVVLAVTLPVVLSKVVVAAVAVLLMIVPSATLLFTLTTTVKAAVSPE